MDRSGQFIPEHRVDGPLAVQAGLAGEVLRNDQQVEMRLASGRGVNASVVVMARVPRAVILDLELLGREG